MPHETRKKATRAVRETAALGVRLQMFVELRNLNIPLLEFKSSYVWHITELYGYSINSASIPYIKDLTHRMGHICKRTQILRWCKVKTLMYWMWCNEGKNACLSRRPPEYGVVAIFFFLTLLPSRWWFTSVSRCQDEMSSFMWHVTYQMTIPFSHPSTAQNITHLYLVVLV